MTPIFSYYSLWVVGLKCFLALDDLRIIYLTVVQLFFTLSYGIKVYTSYMSASPKEGHLSDLPHYLFLEHILCALLLTVIFNTLASYSILSNILKIL